MSLLLQRFADPEAEHAFLRAERIERGQAIRALIVIAVLTLISNIAMSCTRSEPSARCSRG